MKEDVRSSRYIREAQEMLRQLGKSAADVVTDYLKKLWEHTKLEIASALGRSNLEGHPFSVVITVPAIWPVYAQNRLRQAAIAAGILDRRHGGETKLNSCAEPEAAALAVMDDDDGAVVKVTEHRFRISIY